MEKRATYIGKSRCGWNGKDVALHYRYRDHEYEINPQLYTSTAVQHRTEQSRIDALIEREAREATREFSSTNGKTAQDGFDLFWKYVNDEITEEEFYND